MAEKIQARRDTAANWANVNPVLAQGEFGVVIGENRHKIGDGITAWNDLDYPFLEMARTEDLGTAASADVTESATDTTAGRLMKVGDFGVGATQSTADPINTITVPGVYSITGSSQSLNNVPLDFHEGAGVAVLWVANRSDSSTETVTQRFLAIRPGGGNRLSGREFFRYKYTDAEGWTPWVEVFNSASILGTVSESGGAPTGAIIERGSNANGEYIKFADGTLHMWGSLSHQITSTAVGGVDVAVLYYPAAVISNASTAIIASVDSSQSGWDVLPERYKFKVVPRTNNSNTYDLLIYREEAGAATSGKFSVFIAARWY